jgi:hypothetical protein
MNTTNWLIIATAAGPIVATLVAPGFISAVLKLAKARAQRIEHVPVSGTDLYACGVPLTEAQFREVFAAYQSELDELPPPADRSYWEMKRQFAAAQRLAAGQQPGRYRQGSRHHRWPRSLRNRPRQSWPRRSRRPGPGLAGAGRLRGRRRAVPRPGISPTVTPPLRATADQRPESAVVSVVSGVRSGEKVAAALDRFATVYRTKRGRSDMPASRPIIGY